MIKKLIYPCIVSLFVLVAAYSFSEQKLFIDGVQMQGKEDWKTISVGQDGRLDITTAAAPTPTANTIKGTITSGFFAGKTIGIKGVTVNLNGPATGSQTTDVNGGYIFTNLTSMGVYTITPSHVRDSYLFDPTNGTANVVSPNTTAVVNFTANPVTPDKTYSIIGRVADLSGAPLPGVAMELRLGSQLLDNASLTGAKGYYTIPELPDGLIYTVTPVLSGYTFTPPSQDVQISGTDVKAISFTFQKATGGKWSTQAAGARKLDKSTYFDKEMSYIIDGVQILANHTYYFLIDPKGFGIDRPTIPAGYQAWLRIVITTPDQTTLGFDRRIYKLDINCDEIANYEVPGSGDYGADIQYTEAEYNSGVKFLLELIEHLGTSGTVKVYWKWLLVQTR
jgi:hypothetical protein